MQKKITGDMSLRAIENMIVEELQDKDLWGDIPFSVDDYETIRKRIKDIIENSSYEIGNICKNYPVAITTFLVFMMRYKYDVNFWGLMAEELNIGLNSVLETEIGKCIRKTFKKYGFDYSDIKDERRVNMAPIFFEAGIPPESSLENLFYVLSYDIYSFFDPRLIIEDLIDMRSCKIRKPLLNFLQRYRNDRAVEFILEVHDAMLAVEQGRYGESRYIGIYSDWKNRERSNARGNVDKKQEFQTKPYLAFENGKKGLCMVLPRVIMKSEWIDDVEWRIKGNNGVNVTMNMSVYGDEGCRYIQPIEVPIGASNIYQISLLNKDGLNDDVIMNWIIKGIDELGTLFFNSNGRMVTPNYLQMPYGIIILSKKAKIVQSKNITINYQAYPTDREEFSIVQIEPTGRDAELCYMTNGTNKILRMRPQIKVAFEGKHLFGLTNEDNLFTDIPEIIIEMDELEISTGLNLRIEKERLDISSKIKEGNCRLSLKKYENSILKKYGTYSIRLYQDEHFLCQREFSYVPKIKTSYKSEIEWPDKLNCEEKKKYKFERKDDWILEFYGCIVNFDENNYIVECPAGVGSIHGRISSNENSNTFSCGFELPINPFSFDLLNLNGECIEETKGKISRLTLADINDTEYWIRLETFGKYKKHFYKLILRTANGVEQEEMLKLSQTACGNYNLASFYDTLRNCPLPAQIELCCDEDESNSIPIVAFMDVIELSVRPVLVRDSKRDYIAISVYDGGKDLVVKRFGIDKIEYILIYAESKISINGNKRGYPLVERLEPGIYVVEANKSENNFLFVEDSSMVLSHNNNVFLVSNRQNEKTINNFSDWLDQLIREILLTGVNHDIKNGKAFSAITHFSEISESTSICQKDFEKIVALGYFAVEKCIEVKKETIKECMRSIAKYILKPNDRLEIIRMLTNVECSQEVFDICMEEYTLILFETGSYDAKILASEIEKYSIEISMLLLMGSDASVRDTIWREKYRDMIGREAIRNLLTVPNENNLEVIAEEQKKFFREKPCKIRINLTNEISGDMGSIQKMIDYTYKSPKLDITKKPDYGIYFDRIRYVDQYVNWYTNSHTLDGNMLPWKRTLMLEVVQQYCDIIMKYVHALSADSYYGTIIVRYEKALSARTTGDIYANMQTNQHSRYFYLQGMAAILCSIGTHNGQNDEIIKIGESFMIEAMKIAPGIAKRDLIMARTFIYLVRKEEKLCQ